MARLDPAEHADDLLLVADVEVGERLVEQQELRPADERLGDRDPLLLSAGQLGHAAARELAGADGGERAVDPRAARRRTSARAPTGRRMSPSVTRSRQRMASPIAAV